MREAATVIDVYALCTRYIELDRASMVSDLAPGQPWTVPSGVSSWIIRGGSFSSRRACTARRASIRRPAAGPSG